MNMTSVLMVLSPISAMTVCVVETHQKNKKRRVNEMPGTTSKVITIARGVTTNNPAMANALRRWLVATRGDGGEVAREIFKQARAARRERRVNR